MQANNDENTLDLMLLREACAQAADLAMSYFGENPKVWIKPGNSPVSEADFAVDALLKKILLVARPDYGWISEETEDDRPQKNYRRSFIVDPIDGTRGFLEKSPYWCISVAIIENQKPEVGILHCPVKNVVYDAVKNNGATKNQDALSLLGSTEHTRDTTTIISATKSMAKKLAPFIQKSTQFYYNIPSLAYRIALAAEGAINIVLVRPNCHDWDIAAADLILQESGGALVTLEQKYPTYGNSPFTHDFLIACENSRLKNVIDIVQTSKLV
ncbi:3'(2'),5'-bisphosphate nucleotidase CysQ [Bartonella tamiae]|uniref:3'(2'),5'-bisphosphate nucleotidase n=1 Tax=Bartonella tamiae Th239 TaxID=1094558 RepID=J1K068_9HYPH|nr:3'(2'),5'-bisphosphate nucleotidase CysQ [Bartonella tamiae]EJF90797.1 hypothetical protein ME5_00633 [Bartonella tamiae Th239]EJF93418.1 hypothetical protein MEG_01249 [Bartonella tamiae Th307]